MAIVPYVAPEQVVPTNHPFYVAELTLGKVLNLHRVLAHSPRTLEAFATLSLAVYETKLDRRLREIAYFTTVQALDCEM
jgi:alkylhydroperoxidase family enzyme